MITTVVHNSDDYLICLFPAVEAHNAVQRPGLYNGNMSTMPDYEPRFLAGVVLFNRHDFFEAHEVWESLWLDAGIGTDRRFVQGLIQSAVGLYHFGNRNYRGAAKLYRSARGYMEKYASPHWGIDITRFWQDMERCFAPLLASIEPAAETTLVHDLIPTLTLEPPPTSWPDPTEFLDEDEPPRHA